MITIFTTLKPFRDPHISIIQRNAIQSWTRLRPKCEIILFGEDAGVADAAKEFGARHIPQVKLIENRLPLISSLFTTAQKAAAFPYLCCVSGDIIFMDDLLTTLTALRNEYAEFLAVGRRWDMNIIKPISFTQGWQEKLRSQAAKNGILHGYSGIDYFLFPKGLYKKIPDLIVGRSGWDNWMIFNARKRGIPVIDITQRATVVHQEHDLPGTRDQAIRFTDELAKKNLELAGGYGNLLTIRDATFLLTPRGLRRNWYGAVSASYPWRLLLAAKRKIQH